ncbi:hypothetical protein J2X31_002550 [Flavobacterium arsenatis]|uniref:Uncharacterized protein n=1 Tax=Flavobacterium arsenatis TaxID=1484332 RepID=A0ABU1TRM1_9FLAO|nr:hypothetical protein [Flavobacterium arsenatis]
MLYFYATDCKYKIKNILYLIKCNVFTLKLLNVLFISGINNVSKKINHNFIIL